MNDDYHGYTSLRLLISAVMLFMMGACTPSEQGQPSVAANTMEATSTVIVHPTSTMPPTIVPGSSKDSQEATIVVQQFGDAVARGDTIVALLSMSPTAQRLVAAGDLDSFLGRHERLHRLVVRTIRLKKDVALADCLVRYESGETTLLLRLVRLDGAWRIDAPVDTSPMP